MEKLKFVVYDQEPHFYHHTGVPPTPDCQACQSGDTPRVIFQTRSIVRLWELASERSNAWVEISQMSTVKLWA